jgi:hypothetical protein
MVRLRWASSSAAHQAVIFVPAKSTVPFRVGRAAPNGGILDPQIATPEDMPDIPGNKENPDQR